MPRIVPIKWQTFEKFLIYVGCEFVREKGDHRIYDRDDLARPIVVPRYNPLPVMIIKTNLRTLGVDPGQYLEILRRI